MRLFKSLAHSSFTLLWSGQTLSRLGDSIYKIALAWWVLEKTGSATAMGRVLIFSFAPTMLFILAGGVTGDRFSRVRLMLLSDILRGAVLTVVTVLAFRHQLEVWHMYFASACVGLVGAFFQPAYSAIIPEVVPTDALKSANALTSLSKQMCDIVGPSLGAAFIAIGGTSAAFGVNGLSFFVSGACLIPLLRLPSVVVKSSNRPGLIADLREGISMVLRTPWLWISISVFALANITLSAPIFIALPFHIKEDLHGKVGVLGIAYSTLAAGSVITTAWLGRATRFHRRGFRLYGALMILGVATGALGFSRSALSASLIVLVIGASLPLFSLVWVSTLQELIPHAMLGRVSSIDYLGSNVLFPVGLGLVGWAIGEIGASSTLLVGGCLTFLLGVLALTHPAIRALD
jgi:Transmembrane secretion effector